MKQKTCILLTVDQQTIHVKPKNGVRFTLEELQEMVGGYVQLITLPSGRELWMNEDGKNIGLPVNTLATLLWRYVYRNYDIGAEDWVAGNVLYCDPVFTHEPSPLQEELTKSKIVRN